MAKKHGLPKFVFVSEHQGSDAKWLEAVRRIDEAVENDGPTVVGTYQLIKVNRVVKQVRFEKA